jgi:anti-anti-sigma regulatory factor
MALFSKPPAKKPEPLRPDPKARGPAPARPVSAREVAAQADARPGERGRPQPAQADITVTGASLIEFSPSQPASFEVAQANPGLCAMLENAALLFASGQAQPARALLEQGVIGDHDTKLSPLAWLALFDLLQRAGDRAAFDQYALQYVVQFERSAPPWEDRAKPKAALRPVAGGYIGITGKLTAASAPQLEGLKRAIVKDVPQARLDFASVTGFDDAGAKLLADALALARRKRFPLLLQRAERMKPVLDIAVRRGREGGEGSWQLALELLQWSHNQQAFDDRAVEYAVAFEMSPPSWEPPVDVAPPEPPVVPDTPTADGAEAGAVDPNAEMLPWSGVMTGSMPPQLVRLQEFAHTRAIIPVDMTAVERVDFVCAGALLNAVHRIEQQRKAVQIVGATPIVRALLLLIGISPRHFVKKAD